MFFDDSCLGIGLMTFYLDPYARCLLHPNYSITCLCFLESPDADIAMEIATSEQHVSEAVYDCVICGQSGPSTEDRPTGLVVLLQASSGMKRGLLEEPVFQESLTT